MPKTYKPIAGNYLELNDVVSTYKVIFTKVKHNGFLEYEQCGYRIP